MTNEDKESKIDEIIELMDQARFDTRGGYPSQRVFENGKVYVATVDHDDGPELIHMPMNEFIVTHGEILEILEDDY